MVAGKGLNRGLAETLGLPEDLVFDLPRLNMVGNLRAVVQNHRGLREYDSTSVVIDTSRGAMELTGEEMRVEVVTKDELVVKGNIRAVFFAKEEAGGDE